MSRGPRPSRPAVLGSASWRSAAVVLLGLLVIGGLAVIDSRARPGSIVIGTVVLAPFLVSALAGPRATALVAAVAFIVAVSSGAWNHNFDTGAYYLRAAVVLAGGAVSVLAATARRRTTRDRSRFALLADLANIADGRLTLEQTAERLGELLVPTVADICMLDVVGEGGLRRLAVKASGPRAAEREALLLAREPTVAERPGSGSVAARGRPLLLHSPSDELLRAAAHDEADLALLRSLHITASVTVPLRARGRMLGALTLLLVDRSHRRYSEDDVGFVEVLAGRVALALDNAGLFSELATMEAQLTTALGTLSEAVTVQNRHGNLIYANQAAAELLGYATPQQLLATPAAEIAQQYQSFREDGSPLQAEDLPSRRLMEGAAPEPLVVRVVDRRTGEQRWRQTKASAVRDSAGQVRLVVNVVTDITAVKRAELLQRLLSDVGDALTSSPDLDQTLQQVADICVPELADWCAVSMPNEHDQLQTVAVAHSDPAKVALAERLRSAIGIDEPGGAAQVYRDGAPLLANDITDEMLTAAAQDHEHLQALRGLGMRAGLLVPLSTASGTVGVLTLVNAESGRSFGTEDVALASELARRAATAVENARLYTERSRIARTLQDSLVPEPLPARPGWRTATLYRPAGDENRVGGDFYDGFALDQDSWMLVVGDVTGHGAPAAALTALMRHTLRAIATDSGSPHHALDKLNRDLCARPTTSPCTAVSLVVRERDGHTRAELLCAGHPLPILVRAGAAGYVGQYGPLLGAIADASWPPTVLTLAPGDILVLYSDGVLDATGRRDRFGPDRLQDALTAATSADDAVQRISRALADFEVGQQRDDTAVLAVQWLGTPEIATGNGQDQDTASQPMSR